MYVESCSFLCHAIHGIPYNKLSAWLGYDLRGVQA
jgi:hypothetical protein